MQGCSKEPCSQSSEETPYEPHPWELGSRECLGRTHAAASGKPALRMTGVAEGSEDVGKCCATKMTMQHNYTKQSCKASR